MKQKHFIIINNKKTPGMHCSVCCLHIFPLCHAWYCWFSTVPPPYKILELPEFPVLKPGGWVWAVLAVSPVSLLSGCRIPFQKPLFP